MSSRLWSCVIAACAACSSDVSLGGPNTLVRVDVEPDGPNCTGGGAAIHTGLDQDGDRFLDDAEVASTQYVCNGSTSVQCSTGDILEGTITVRSSAELSALAGVNCIDGDLLIAGTDADDLDALSDLQTITGDIVIAGNGELTSLSGLRNLAQVGDTYLVQGNDKLADIAAIGGLRRAAQITIVGNDGLTDLSGFESFVDLHSLLTIANNGNLTSLSGLDNLTTTSRTLVIRANRNLTSLAALDRLRSGVLIEISGNASLPQVSLAALEKVDGRILVNTNAAATRVTFPALTTVGDFIQLNGNAALTTVELPALLTIAGLLVNNATSLAALRAPSLVFATGSIELQAVARLVSLDFADLGSIGGGLLINNAPMLPSLAGFPRLGSIGQALTVNAAGGLTSFSGLGALEVVSGDLNITGNARLNSFGGLGALTEVGEDLTIAANPMLPAGSAQAFASGITVRGNVTVN